MTPKEAGSLLVVAELGGLTRPAALTGRALEPACQVYADALNRAGVDFSTAHDALLAYLAEPHVSGFPKAWPDPGTIIARTPAHRARAARLADLGGLFARILRCRASMGPDAGADLSRIGDLAPDEVKAARAAVDALGGWRALGSIPVDGAGYAVEAKRFAAAFDAALRAIPVVKSSARLTVVQ
jgi:hypothetical protein